MPRNKEVWAQSMFKYINPFLTRKLQSGPAVVLFYHASTTSCKYMHFVQCFYTCTLRYARKIEALKTT